MYTDENKLIAVYYSIHLLRDSIELVADTFLTPGSC